MKNMSARRLSVVVIAILTAALALSASAGAQSRRPQGRPHCLHEHEGRPGRHLHDGRRGLHAGQPHPRPDDRLANRLGARLVAEWRVGRVPASLHQGSGTGDAAVRRQFVRERDACPDADDQSRSDRPASGVVAGREHDRVLEQSSRPLRAVHGQGDGHRPRAADIHERRDREPRASLVAGRAIDRLRSSPVEHRPRNPIDPHGLDLQALVHEQRGSASDEPAARTKRRASRPGRPTAGRSPSRATARGTGTSTSSTARSARRA